MHDICMVRYPEGPGNLPELQSRMLRLDICRSQAHLKNDYRLHNLTAEHMSIDISISDVTSAASYEERAPMEKIFEPLLPPHGARPGS